MAFALPHLPYPGDALEPHISERTMSFHHGKHHRGYVEKLNKLVAHTPLENKTLEEIILATARDSKATSIFNNAAQCWNHALFWQSMSPGAGGAPKGVLAERIEKSFKSYEAFKEQFIDAAAAQFGSGWVWLVEDKDGALKIVPTANALCPMVHGQKALLTCDVWEHAYYLDYQNLRADFVTAFLDKLANWAFAERRHKEKPADVQAARASG